MIEFSNINKTEPYRKFINFYEKASLAKQETIEAISISSYNTDTLEVDSRYVNLKFIQNNEWIFFSNYNSPKAKAFSKHNQISALFYWNKINVQIRMRANIKQTKKSISDLHFLSRDDKKNAIAISSNQSKPINSYEDIKKNYLKSLEGDNLRKCPEYWGGFSFIPYYFEFWEGHESRINKREIFDKIDGAWNKSFLQP